MTDRFGGTVYRLAPMDVGTLVDWITAIPFEDWPQQDRLHGELRPAMVTDLRWHAFGRMTDALVQGVLGLTSGGAFNRLLSVVMPGHEIPEHVDQQPAHWWARVHVPLTSTPESAFTVGGVAHHLEPGWAYLVNTLMPHAVTNPGRVPRIHFMVDVGAQG